MNSKKAKIQCPLPTEERQNVERNLAVMFRIYASLARILIHLQPRAGAYPRIHPKNLLIEESLYRNHEGPTRFVRHSLTRTISLHATDFLFGNSTQRNWLTEYCSSKLLTIIHSNPNLLR